MKIENGDQDKSDFKNLQRDSQIFTENNRHSQR
jgi:hypothetical protein